LSFKNILKYIETVSEQVWQNWSNSWGCYLPTEIFFKHFSQISCSFTKGSLHSKSYFVPPMTSFAMCLLEVPGRVWWINSSLEEKLLNVLFIWNDSVASLLNLQVHGFQSSTNHISCKPIYIFHYAIFTCSLIKMFLSFLDGGIDIYLKHAFRFMVHHQSSFILMKHPCIISH
jgi:hypothetical protein